MKIAIAADDLTSATDGAQPFVSAGQSCDVWLDPAHMPQATSSVLSINKDSRARAASEAAQLSERVAGQLASRDILYHTVDSTIRGHIEVEVLAALKASGRKVALFAPAFPDAGRTTERGEQLVDGRPMTMTIYASDPVHPVKEGRIRKIFSCLSDQAVKHLSLTDVRMLKPNGFATQSVPLVIADATLQSDLDQLVASINNPKDVLFCGSPGMALALSKRFRATHRVDLPLSPATKILTVVGSANAKSATQKRMLLSEPGVVHFEIDAALASQSPAAATTKAIQKVLSADQTSSDYVISTGTFVKSDAQSSRINEVIGNVAAHVIKMRAIDGLVLTGGDTAAAVLRALGVRNLKLGGEVEPGIPIGLTAIPRPMTIVTKAGGFGSVDVLSKASRLLRHSERIVLL
jgi:D-threonate/D-erythronate kinase